jgi:hypothetical protein
MQRSNREWLVPLTGIAFIVLLFVSFIVQGEPKDAKHPVNEIVGWYADNKDSAEIGAFIGMVAGAVLIFFAAYLRKVLAAAEGSNPMLPVLSLVGLSIVAIGGAFDGTILFATAEAADDIPPTSVQTLQALWDNDFLIFILGIIVFLWSTGICVLRTGALPKWLGWAALVLGVVALVPADVGFAAVIGSALWIVVVSILLSLRARRGVETPPSSTPATPAPPSPTPTY